MDVPGEVRAAIGAVVAKLRGACRSARWVRIEGAHVTLKFIGEVSPEKVDSIRAALAAVPFPAPIAIRFGGVGFFPGERHPRVLWAGVQAGPELTALAAAVAAALVPVGIADEGRAFSPHLTLARFNSPGALDGLHAAIQAAGALAFGGTVAKEYHLYQSVLKPGGAEYTRLATFPCSGGGSE
jgi:2'-5' RNA ligase